MTTIFEAKKLIQTHCIQTNHVKRLLTDSIGFVLSQDIISPLSLPSFDQSAMDGYAIYSENDNLKTFNLTSEVKAGDNQPTALKPGECARIFTGAMVPEGTTAVVMQEKVTVKNDCILINEEVKKGLNIRLKGEQINKGELALKKGTILNPAGIGFLSGLGITEVSVFDKVKISIIVTGNELTPPCEPLEKGKIYESNSQMLNAALQASHFEINQTVWVKDDLESTIQAIENAHHQSDVVLISGGISVGDYDFVSQALQRIKVEEVFHKVNQKPGKPLYFGKKENTLFFGLPGNPSASLVCFYYYILPVLRQASGISSSDLEKRTLISQSNFIKKGQRPQFLKASVNEKEIYFLDGQSSAMLHSFAKANALAYLPANTTELKKGEEVTAFILPSFVS